ncbi:hypothetical protein SEA_DEJAVU_70 [Microbacterium Phage DejaVu]|nr:hypothetical protein LUPINE_67 [Microbacterium phage Lupine]QDH92218.1 hypothetical protein SEA_PHILLYPHILLY_68 [Microbacterium phage PhillyPhilly]QDK03313.1 hypothetical protein SEA_ROMAN_71 [Microbacterium phage Roman]QIG58614.1 hypothetical protein SEA_HUBBS_69 [Microbacterium phage Hubbs]UVG34125.1 hypothetical protein SEA_PAVLO_68 [Microbacterium phage Pavlo]WNM66202.1 hypothetical protein SEA_DEJAVU_70 [Microbacterium Phage DejaVu]
MNETELPEGTVLANGHIYKVYFVPGEERPTDIQIARALQALGAVKIEHITDGGTNVAITPTIKKENA